MNHDQIAHECSTLGSKTTRGDLGAAIAAIALSYSPRDMQRMRRNFSQSIRHVAPEYRAALEASVAEHLNGTYQSIRKMQNLRSFDHMREPVPPGAADFWAMVAAQCATGDEQQLRVRFLKFLLAAFCMLVQGLPGHPVGMPFPGRDRVALIDGIYYCPVREKANDVDSALCPFCPALQTPEIGYLKPPVKGSEHRKQEFIEQTYRHHHFNG